MSRKRKPKPITAKSLYDLIGLLEDKNIPIVMVGERQIAVAAWIVTQEQLGGEFGDEKVPVAVQIQLIPA